MITEGLGVIYMCDIYIVSKGFFLHLRILDFQTVQVFWVFLLRFLYCGVRIWHDVHGFIRVGIGYYYSRFDWVCLFSYCFVYKAAHLPLYLHI